MRWILINALLLASCIDIPEHDFTLRPGDTLPSDSAVDVQTDAEQDVDPSHDLRPNIRDMNLDVRDMGTDIMSDALPRDMAPPVPDALPPEPACLGRLEGTWSAYILLSSSDNPNSLTSADFELQISEKGSVSSHFYLFGEIDLSTSCPSPAPDAGLPDVGAPPDAGSIDVGPLDLGTPSDLTLRSDAQLGNPPDVRPPEGARADPLGLPEVQGVPGFADTWIVTPPELGVPVTFVFDAASGLGFFYATAEPVFGVLARRSEQNIARRLHYLGVTTDQNNHTRGLIQTGDGNWSDCEHEANSCLEMTYQNPDQHVRFNRIPIDPDSRSYYCTPTPLGAACGLRIDPNGIDQAVGIAFMMNELQLLPENVQYRCAGIRSIENQPITFEDVLIRSDDTLTSDHGVASFLRSNSGIAEYAGDAGLFGTPNLSVAAIQGGSMLMIFGQNLPDDPHPWTMAICRADP